VAAGTGCAPTFSKGSFQGIGEYDPRANQAVADRYRALQEAPPAEAAGVKVLYETVPEGLEVKGDVVSVADGYPLVILGKYGLAGPVGGPWAFSDYKSTGRKVYCYWQTPLTLVTLGLWALAVPVSYPCWTKSLTQEEWIDELRLLAVAAGGNLVLASPNAGGAVGVILRASPDYLAKMGRSRRAPPPSPPPPGVKTL
jgi:hypothetical protein